ncbi:MAG: hypothetical protein ABUK01_03295 [Leptospirales bacterium]
MLAAAQYKPKDHNLTVSYFDEHENSYFSPHFNSLTSVIGNIIDDYANTLFRSTGQIQKDVIHPAMEGAGYAIADALNAVFAESAPKINNYATRF